MNYRHIYHAGNFADVVKHVILTALLSSLARKDAPYCYIDTHAGIGYYDLFAQESQKTKEFINGIEKVIAQDNPPPVVKTFLQAVHAINNRLLHAQYASLRYYPGSPMIARHFARPHDRLIASELHPDDYQTLRQTFAGDKQVSIHHMDGFLGLKAFLPPKERRGLVLIDPPYEDTDEFSRLAQHLPMALKKWETGMYAIWFPIKDRPQVERFYRSLETHVERPILAVELSIYPDLAHHLNGTGMAIINPPWQFDTTLQETLPWLWKALTINEQGRFSVSRLK